MNDIKSSLKKREHRWLTSKAKSFSSPSHGLGIRAMTDIKKGEDVLVYGGIIIHKSKINDYWKTMGHVGTQIDDNFFIVPTSREELKNQGVINHSCEPNVGFKNQIQLYAIRGIKAGEEIFVDYSFCESLYSNSFKCNCETKHCRKIITKNDWKIKRIQNKYFKYFSPYLKAKIKNTRWP